MENKLTKDTLYYNGLKIPIVKFDIEVWPEWWVICFQRKDFTFKISKDDFEDKIIQLKYILNKSIIVAHNAKHFDLKILQAIMKHNDAEDIHKLTTHIIEKPSIDPFIKMLDNYRYYNDYKFIDTMDDKKIGIKKYAANIGEKIYEAPVPLGKLNLTNEDKQNIIDYCFYDLKILDKYFDYRLDYFSSKIVLAEIYNIDIYKTLKATNAKMLQYVIGVKRLSASDLVDTKYEIPKKIKPFFLKFLPQDIFEYYTQTYRKNIVEKVWKYFNNKIVTNAGGLHTTFDNNIVIKGKSKKYKSVIVKRKSDKYLYFDIDIINMYLTIILNFGFASRAFLKKDELRIVSDQRDFYKQIGDKKKANAFKVVAVTSYGVAGSKWLDTYDPIMATNVTFTGQLTYIALCNYLFQKMDVQFMQSNTDGIFTEILRSEKDKFLKIINKALDYLNLKAKFNEFDILFQRDVNNYIYKDVEGLIKTKGFLNQALTANESNFDVTNPLDCRIVHEACIQYLLNGIPLKKTIMECTNLLHFCQVTHCGRMFKHVVHEVKGEDIIVNKVNRVIATTLKSRGSLYKIQTNKRHKIAKIPMNVLVLNDNMEKYKFEKYKKVIDYDWYIDYAKHKIECFEGK